MPEDYRCSICGKKITGTLNIRQNLDVYNNKIPGDFLILCKECCDSWDNFEDSYVRLTPKGRSYQPKRGKDRYEVKKISRPSRKLPYRKLYRHGGRGDGWYNDDNIVERTWKLDNRRFRMVIDEFNNEILEMEGDPVVAYAIEMYEKLDGKYVWLRHLLPEIKNFLKDSPLALNLLKSYIVESPRDIYRIYKENRFRKFTKKELLDLFYQTNIF